MASRVGPRSVKDATRFTSTIPHATSKTAGASVAGAPSPAAKAAAKTASQRAARLPGETPEQRVKRLRQAHLAAQKAQISTSDKLIDGSRRVLNVVHRFTVTGVVIFTVVAGIVSIYSVWDMIRYNRARRAEWLAAQKALEDDALASARMAYMQGKATPEQITMVEEANREAEAHGTKLPPLLSPPERRTHFEETIQPKLQGEGKGVFGVVAGLFGGGKTEAGEAAVAVADDAASGVTHTGKAVEEKASAAWEAELENQRRGGPLDQLGLDTASSSSTENKKKGWGWW
ncbi:hypothetical protein NLU13_4353 [Sarocladium strictum]|uniref:Cytochrome oxidase c assembly-domain-containing protein n=1 Tax=Sarocladium strictum TaxID=5046 RepID=A0AA39GJI2_SARSR|nr:hypothetical protein NLU13_4353 [Sarocladium strictum]